MSTYVLRKGVASLDDLVDGSSAKGVPGANWTGEDYFVNNITGASGNSGLTWGDAFAQPSQAVTASTAHLATQTSGNEYGRNRIFIQGTSTAYTALTSLAHYTDYIGVGADPLGNGAGIARIGADSGVSEGVLLTATLRGANFYNLQFQAGTAGYAFKGTNMFRSRFENCVFAGNGSPGGDPAAGFEMGIAGGVTIKDCTWLNQSSGAAQFTVGINITSTHFHGCRVENCIIGGDVGVAIASGCINAWSSWFKDCYIGKLGGACSIGVDDNATAGYIQYVNCSVNATDAFDLANNANRIIGCYAVNAFAT